MSSIINARKSPEGVLLAYRIGNVKEDSPSNQLSVISHDGVLGWIIDVELPYPYNVILPAGYEYPKVHDDTVRGQRFIESDEICSSWPLKYMVEGESFVGDYRMRLAAGQYALSVGKKLTAVKVYQSPDKDSMKDRYRVWVLPENCSTSIGRSPKPISQLPLRYLQANNVDTTKLTMQERMELAAQMKREQTAAAAGIQADDRRAYASHGFKDLDDLLSKYLWAWTEPGTDNPNTILSAKVGDAVNLAQEWFFFGEDGQRFIDVWCATRGREFDNMTNDAGEHIVRAIRVK